MAEEIEVLDESFNEQPIKEDNIITLDSIMASSSENSTEPKDVIDLNRLFDEDDEDVIDVYEEEQKLEEIKQKRITKIQIGLIIFLVVFASLFYFFGYDLVEPFIKID